MFIITPDQNYILNILKKTKFMKADQAFRLLKAIDSGKKEQYVKRTLNQLQYMGKITWKTNEIFTMPVLYKTPVDKDMLSAIDIMTDLTDSKVISLLSHNHPYKLCFYIEQRNDVGSYAVIVVSPGSEAKITAALYGADSESRTIIFLLSDFSQKDKIKTTSPHFFAINDNGKYRYFQGGDRINHLF